MPEIHIPGVTTSRYRTDELVDGLMRIERIPRDRADMQLQLYRNQQNAWRQLSQQVVGLRDSARTLYTFNNPFAEKIGSSSDSLAVSVAATREAEVQEFSISVLQVAAADSFLSREIPGDASVPEGTYVFAVGDKSIQFSWKGGSYPEFVQALNRRGQGIIRAQLIQTAPGKRALLVESLKTGADQKLRFQGAAHDLALEIGLIEKKLPHSVSVELENAEVQPESKEVIGFSQPVMASSRYVLEYTVTSERLPETQEEEVAPSPQLPMPKDITYSGIRIVNDDSVTALPPLPIPLPVEPVDSNSVLALRSTQGDSIPLPDIPQEGSQTFSIPLGDLGDVDAILVDNINTGRSVVISDIAIYVSESEDGYGPVNPVSVAQDAVIRYEGIEIARHENSIDDLVPGVTLNIHRESDLPVRISIAPDTEAAKDAIIAFVANYNRVIAEINILTQNKPEIIAEIQYFSPEERDRAEQNLGMMQGETLLNTLKSSLQRITSNPYTADESSSFSLLAQIGISTRSDSGAGIDPSRLRGYLEINESLLDSALETSIQSVRSLFGFDSDGDLVVDSGVAVAVSDNVAPYVQTGGIFAARTAGLDARISEAERSIGQLDQQLDRKEADLRRRYSQMEGALNRLEDQSESISNFNRRNFRQD